jgi:DNA-binding NarL/FixJ family response regulator
MALRGWALLSRDAGSAMIAGAARAAASGLLVLDPSAASLLGSRTDAATAGELAEAPAVEALTPRETEVLQWMAQGLPNKVIAARLGVSLHTIKFHVVSILAKLGAASRTEAVTIGVRTGLILL